MVGTDSELPAAAGPTAATVNINSAEGNDEQNAYSGSGYRNNGMNNNGGTGGYNNYSAFKNLWLAPKFCHFGQFQINFEISISGPRKKKKWLNNRI